MIKLIDLLEKKGIDRDDDGDIDSKDWKISRDLAIKKRLQKEGEDHEVAMAQNSLKDIARAAIELSQKMGGEERNIPGWIQDHITNAENYIEQAAQGFHELKQDEMNEARRMQHLAGLLKEEEYYGNYDEDQVRQMLVNAGKDEAEVDNFMNDDDGYFSWSNMSFDQEPTPEDIKNAFIDAFEEWSTGGTDSLYE
jgi:hypothetical protein